MMLIGLVPGHCYLLIFLNRAAHLVYYAHSMHRVYFYFKLFHILVLRAEFWFWLYHFLAIANLLLFVWKRARMMV